MTSTTTPTVPTARSGRGTDREARAAAPFRSPLLTLAGGALVVGSVLYVAGMATSPPQASEGTADYIASLAADPAQTQLSAVLLHYANLALGVGVLGVPSLLLSRRGARATVVGALAAAVGYLTLAGWVLYDFWMMEIGASLPAETSVPLADAVQSAPFFAVGGMLPLVGILGGLVMLGGLARAGVVGWWALGVVLVTGVAAAVVPFSPYLHTPLTAASVAPLAVVGVRLVQRRRAEAALGR